MLYFLLITHFLSFDIAKVSTKITPQKELCGVTEVITEVRNFLRKCFLKFL